MNAIDVFQEWLDNYLNFERTPQKEIFWLDTIDYLCKRFNNPQDYAPCIHVAGSKGKGKSQIWTYTQDKEINDKFTKEAKDLFVVYQDSLGKYVPSHFLWRI